jgi:hypothetical protein
MQDPQTAGAKCPVHPDRAATRTCGRCGNFTCGECNVNGTEAMCPSCRQLVGGSAPFPFTRDAFSFDQIWNYTFEAWKREWVMLSVCVLILLAVGFAVGLFNGLFQGIAKGIVGTRGGSSGVIIIAFAASMMTQVISSLAQGVFQMGLFRIYIDVLNGRKADVNRLMSQVPKLGRYILQALLMLVGAMLPVLVYMGGVFLLSLAVSGASLTNIQHLDREFKPIGLAVILFGATALVPILIYLGLPLQFAIIELVYGDTQPIESFRRAFQIANGFRLSLFGFGFIAGLVVLAGILACCVGMIPAMALSQMLMTGLYLTLRNGSGLPPPPEP